MEYFKKNTKQEILYWAERLYQKGMSPYTSGNISLRVQKGILISSSGVCLNDMQEEDIVLTDFSGNLIEGNKKPSSEKIMHTEIYKKREDINAIIHSHCPIITAFAVAGVEIKKPILPDFALLCDKVPLIPYYCPSSVELASSVGEYFEKYSMVLLKNHGVVVGADSLQNAFYHLEMLRTYCEMYFGAEVLGGAKALSKKDVVEIRQLYIKK